jgi:hypothetical protein
VQSACCCVGGLEVEAELALLSDVESEEEAEAEEKEEEDNGIAKPFQASQLSSCKASTGPEIVEDT